MSQFENKGASQLTDEGVVSLQKIRVTRFRWSR